MRWLILAAVPLLGWLLADHISLRRRVAALEGVAPMLTVHSKRVVRSLSLRGPTLVLLVDDLCLGCRDVYMRFQEVPVDPRRVVLADSERSIAAFRALPAKGDADLYGDPRSFATLDNGIHPSLLALDFRGAVLQCTPIGSVEQLDAVLSSIALSPSTS
jgi:hypothetical protein